MNKPVLSTPNYFYASTLTDCAMSKNIIIADEVTRAVKVEGKWSALRDMFANEDQFHSRMTALINKKLVYYKP